MKYLSSVLPSVLRETPGSLEKESYSKVDIRSSVMYGQGFADILLKYSAAAGLTCVNKEKLVEKLKRNMMAMRNFNYKLAASYAMRTDPFGYGYMKKTDMLVEACKNLVLDI